METLLGDSSNAKDKLGWVPKITFEELVKEMVLSDLKEAERNQLCQTRLLRRVLSISFLFGPSGFVLSNCILPL